MEPENKLARLVSAFWARMHDPIQLRAFLCGTLLLLWYACGYGQFATGIEEATRARAQENRHLGLASDIETLRAQVKRFQGRLPRNTDPNEWVEYVLGGIRKYPLKLVAMTPAPVRSHGPYNLVGLRIELEGAFPDLDRLLVWLESNERLFRIESIRVEPHRANNGVIVMQLFVLGVMG
jgi:hypothetical protein